MRILSILIVALLVLASSIPAVQSDPKSRIIALTSDPKEKKNFSAEGCDVVHDLMDATAFECPDDVSKKHLSTGRAVRDEILTIVDSVANHQIGADSVWSSLGYTGSGVTVAVLDTGVDYTHSQLSSSTCGISSNTCGRSFVRYTSSFFDDHGHGTHVSGIITSDGVTYTQSKGVAPNARVWMGKVCDNSGSCYTSDIAAGIEYVVNNNIAKILSISLGGGGTTLSNCDSDYLASKVNWAVDHGVSVAVAAGNDGLRVSSPGCASKAIAVGAVDRNDVRASFSGLGAALDIMAPGVSIYSTLPGNSYASWSGTSMATPHIAATIALMMEKVPSLTNSEIKTALYTTAKDLGTSGWDKYYGNGRVNALNAVNSVPAAGPPSSGSLSVSVTTDKTTYNRNSFAPITVIVTDSSTSNGISGATVTVTVTNPKGGVSSATGATDINGVAVFKYNINRNAAKGLYTVRADASAIGYTTGSATTTFTVN